MRRPTAKALRGLPAVAALARADVQCAEPGDRRIAGATRVEIGEALLWIERVIAEERSLRKQDRALTRLLNAPVVQPRWR